MDIRFNTGIGNKNINNSNTKKHSASGAYIDTRDKLGSVKNPQWGYTKPFFVKEPSVETAETVVTEKPGSLKDTGSLPGGMDSIPGPSAAVVSRQVKQLSDMGLQFLKKGFMTIFGKNRLSPDETSKILTGSDKSAKSKLMVKIGDGDAVPINTGEDVRELAFFKGISDEQLAKADVADFLRYVEKTGVKFNSKGGKDIGGYGAYNYLDKGWAIAGEGSAPVNLVRDGINIMTIDPNKSFDGKAAKKEFEEAWDAYEKLNGFDTEDYQNKKYLKTLDKPLFDFSFVEKFRHFDTMDLYCDRAIDKYKTLSKKAENKAEYLDMVDVLENQDLVMAHLDKYSEFDPDQVAAIMDRKGPKDASPRLKSEIMRELSKPLISNNYSHYRRSYVLNSFNTVVKNANNSSDLKNLSKMYIDMHNSLHTRLRFDSNNVGGEIEKSQKAFKFIIDKLGKDNTKAEAFNGILRCGKDVDECIGMYDIIEPPVKGEDFKVRAETAHVLAGTKHFGENFKTILETLNPGENHTEWANLIKEMEDVYREDPQSARKMFVDVKNIALNNQGAASECIKLVKTLQSDSTFFKDALGLIGKPVKGEGFRTRTDILAKFRENHKNERKLRKTPQTCDRETLEDYKTISSNIARSDTLESAANRFQMLMDSLNGNKNTKAVRNIYVQLTREIDKEDSLISRERIEELVNETDIYLYSSDPIDKIEAYIKKTVNSIRELKGIKDVGNKKHITEDEKTVNIGGVQLDKNR